MSALASAACVHALALGKLAEFRFPGARYEVSGAALCVISAEGFNLMAFGGGVWQAAWMEDAQGVAIGLAPSMTPHASPSQPETPAVSSPKTISANKDARALLAQRAMESVSSTPYSGLKQLALDLNVEPSELERALSEALHLGQASFEALALQAPQRFMDAALPEIIERQRPRSISDIMGFLNATPDALNCDYVQLRIWLARNPLPRRPPVPPAT